MEYQEENNYPKAFLATGIILAVMLALCYFIIFHNPPLPDDGTGGILVNYGTTDKGMGNDINSTEEPSVSPKANHSQPTKVTQAQPTEEKTHVTASDQKVVTQNIEDAPEVAANSKKTSRQVATTPAKPVKKEVVNQAALYKGPSKTGSGTGDGTTNTPGNQGSRNGSPLASNYGEGGSGNGLQGTQWSFVVYPEIKNTSRTPGTVVVDVTIDANGNIIEAHSDRKTRMSDLALIDRAVNAVKGSRLTSSAPAKGVQKSQVVIKFNVD
jgi:outer membrane biosynthesis protein TonB